MRRQSDAVICGDRMQRRQRRGLICSIGPLGGEATRFRRRSCVLQIGTGKGPPMISRRTIVRAFTAGTFLAGVLPVLAKARPFEWIRNVGPGKDGPGRLAEAKKAASALFDKLDRDHDGTL